HEGRPGEVHRGRRLGLHRQAGERGAAAVAAARVAVPPGRTPPMSAPPDGDDPEALEVGLLLEAVFRRYGFDFRDYAPASIRGRVRERVQTEGLGGVAELQGKLLHDPAAMERFLLRVSVNVTTMFRDPGFYRAFRERVVPELRACPFLRLWHV